MQVVLEEFRCKWKNEVGVRKDEDNDQASIVPVADVDEFDIVKRVRIFMSVHAHVNFQPSILGPRPFPSWCGA